MDIPCSQMLVFVASLGSSTCGKCQDQVSLAYISNKPIVVISKTAKEPTLKHFNIGMWVFVVDSAVPIPFCLYRKLTLDSLRYTEFDTNEDTVTKQFVQLVQEELMPKEVWPTYLSNKFTNTVFKIVYGVECLVYQSPLCVQHGRSLSPADSSIALMPSGKARLNTKLRAQSTVKDFGGTEEQHINTFWERNFPDDDTVPWFKFQQAFLSDYQAQLSGNTMHTDSFVLFWLTYRLNQL